MPNSHEININITFKNTSSSDALKSYATEKLESCLKKYVHHNTNVNLLFNLEKNRHIAEVTFHSDGFDFHSKEETNDLYASLDKLVDTITHQLRKHKEKLTQHH